MIEAVGERYWDAYFAALDQHLAPGGRIGLQTITMPHDRMLATRHTYTWIQKYIFPGGLLPSVTAIEDSLARSTRLRITARTDFGPHYAETLRIWRDRFQRARGRGRPARLRRRVRPHVDLLPVLLRGRLPVRLHRRQPAHPGPHMKASAATATAALSPVRGHARPRPRSGRSPAWESRSGRRPRRPTASSGSAAVGTAGPATGR